VADIAIDAEAERPEAAQRHDAGAREDARGARRRVRVAGAQGRRGALVGLVEQGQQRVRAAASLVHARVAEPPVPLVADVAAPVALVGPGQTARAEGAGLQPARRVLCRERPSPLRAAGGDCGRDVALGVQHVRLLGVAGDLAGAAQFFKLRPCRVAEAEPVWAAEPGAVAGQAEVVVAVEAKGAGVVERVFDVGTEAAVAFDRGLGIAWQICSVRARG